MCGCEHPKKNKSVHKYVTGIHLSSYVTDLPNGTIYGWDADMGEMVAYKGKVISVEDLPKKVKVKKMANGGSVDSELNDFDLSELDFLEERYYANFSKTMSKAEALKVIINSIEGDYSQLNPKLSEIAEKYYSEEFKNGGSISNLNSNIFLLSDADRIKYIHSVITKDSHFSDYQLNFNQFSVYINVAIKNYLVHDKKNPIITKFGEAIYFEPHKKDIKKYGFNKAHVKYATHFISGYVDNTEKKDIRTFDKSKFDAMEILIPSLLSPDVVRLSQKADKEKNRKDAIVYAKEIVIDRVRCVILITEVTKEGEVRSVTFFPKKECGYIQKQTKKGEWVNAPINATTKDNRPPDVPQAMSTGGSLSHSSNNKGNTILNKNQNLSMKLYGVDCKVIVEYQIIDNQIVVNGEVITVDELYRRYIYEPEEFKLGGSIKKPKNWISGALSGGENKGALRRTAMRKGLLRNDEENLSLTDLHKLEKVGGKTSKRAYLAETLKGFENGGTIDSNRSFHENDYNRLIQSDGGFEGRWSGFVWEIYHDDGGGKVLGKFNPHKRTLFIAGKKDLSNPLVKWLQQNSYVNSDEYYKLADGGGVGRKIIGKVGSKYKADLYKIDAIDREKGDRPEVTLYKDTEKELKDAVSVFLDEEFKEANLFEKRKGKYINFSTELKFKEGGSIGKTFDEQYEENRPLRLKAAKEYYSNKQKFETIEDARKSKKKYGNWICRVKLEDGTEFYTITNFQYNWVKSGDVYGIWNELTLIEKTKHSMEEGGDVSDLLFTTNSYGKLNPVKKSFSGYIGELISTNTAEMALGRKIDSWDDNIITIDGTRYKKVFLRPEYKQID